MEVPPGTCRSSTRPILVTKRAARPYFKRRTYLSKMNLKSSKLRCIGSLLFEVTKHDDADVTRVPILHVCALPRHRSTRPNPSRGIDRIVVTDIRPSFRAMKRTDPLQSIYRSLLGTIGKYGHPIVVHRHVLDWSHPVHISEVRGGSRPRGSRKDIGELHHTLSLWLDGGINTAGHTAFPNCWIVWLRQPTGHRSSGTSRQCDRTKHPHRAASTPFVDRMRLSSQRDSVHVLACSRLRAMSNC